VALSQKLATVNSESIVFLDGFPRSIEQVESFFQTPIISSLQLSCIHLKLRRSWASKKSQGRLICPECDHSYNDASIREDGIVWLADLPQIPRCGRETGCGYHRLERRADEKAFHRRYDLYETVEVPAGDSLASKVPSKSIDISGGYEVMALAIARAVFELLQIEFSVPKLPKRG